MKNLVNKVAHVRALYLNQITGLAKQLQNMPTAGSTHDMVQSSAGIKKTGFWAVGTVS